MGNAPTQPQPAEGAPDDGPATGAPSAPTQPQPAEGGDDIPAGGTGSADG